MATVEERVAAGAALLDSKRPDWYKDIDCATLNIAMSNVCVCGQLYGSYQEGLGALGTGSGSQFGFTVGDTTTDVINAAWREAIASRRLEHAPVLV